jgi:hypothetical protein
VIAGSVFFLSWTAISLPATMDMVSNVLPMNKRTMGVSMHSLVRRVPMALGPVLGGILIGLYGERDGVHLAFGAYYLVRDVIVSVAAFGGAFLWHMSPATNFLIAFGFGLLGTLAFALFGKDLKSTEIIS